MQHHLSKCPHNAHEDGVVHVRPVGGAVTLPQKYTKTGEDMEHVQKTFSW